jgi:hypothetical protein
VSTFPHTLKRVKHMSSCQVGAEKGLAGSPEGRRRWENGPQTCFGHLELWPASARSCNLHVRSLLPLGVSSLGKIKPIEENQKTLLRYTIQETELCASKVWNCTLQNKIYICVSKLAIRPDPVMATTETASCIDSSKSTGRM